MPSDPKICHIFCEGQSLENLFLLDLHYQTTQEAKQKKDKKETFTIEITKETFRTHEKQTFMYLHNKFLVNKLFCH